ncbi:hypothetical protein ACFVR2_22890 [Gottfriedia sp. NPDC057991]|uniref:hypothetical protein n=1 Tax=Gottfriedia sp. NPDC057991 TaxID=3346298 RepID=UPI0036DD4556
MKKFIAFLLVFVLSITVFVKPGFVKADSGDNELIQTPGSYQEYLEEQIQQNISSGYEDPDLTAAYNQYMNYTDEEKTNFINSLNYLNQPEVTTTTVNAIDELEAPGEVELGQGIELVREDSSVVAPPDSRIIGGTYKTVTFKMTIFGLSVSSFSLTLYYNYKNGDYVTSTNGALTAHKNFNPAVIITDGSAVGWADGGYGFANGNFRIASVATLGFVSFTKRIEMKNVDPNGCDARFFTP